MKKALIAAVAVTGLAAVFAIMPPAHAPKQEPGFTGTYLAKSEKELSWITCEKVTLDIIRCEWIRMLAKPDFTYGERQMLFAGMVKGGKLDMESDIKLPGNYKVTAVAERRGSKMAMSVYLQGKVNFTGEYTPASALELGVAKAEFKKQQALNRENHIRAVEASITDEERARRHLQKERKELTEEGNFYVGQIKEFLGQYQGTQKEYAHNTGKLKDYLANVKLASGGGNAHLRRMLLASMRDIVALTETAQRAHVHFISDYNNKILPFLEKLAEKRMTCLKPQAEAKDKVAAVKAQGEKAICNNAFNIENTLLGFTRDIRKAIEAVNVSYAKEIKEQLDIIKQAEQVK